MSGWTPERLVVCHLAHPEDRIVTIYPEANRSQPHSQAFALAGRDAGDARGQADEIVRRWNAHADLVEALRAMIDADVHGHGEIEDVHGCERCDLALAQARALLARIEGKP